MELKWYQKVLYSILIVSPVLALLSLICIIYFGYLLTYVNLLIQTNNQENKEYPFGSTTSIENAYNKGISLLISVSFFTFMMFINFLRTVFMHPGYLPSPIEIESKIALKQSNMDIEFSNEASKEDKIESSHKAKFCQSKIKFFNCFNQTLHKGPLNMTEVEILTRNLKFYSKNFDDIYELIKDDVSSNHNNTNSDVIEIKSTKKVECKEDLFSNLTYANLTKLQLCETCLRYKIERSHHCKFCGKCVLKMDHHCPWLANCIGFRNYKFYLLIQFYGLITSVIIASTYWEVIVNDFINQTSNYVESWLYMFIYLCNFGMLIFLLYLIIVNYKLVLSNTTYIENNERQRSLNKNANIYDLGIYRNICSVFGANPLLWLLPFGENTKGEGIVFDNIYKLRSLERSN